MNVVMPGEFLNVAEVARSSIGDVGTVVHVYADGQAFEVEFTTLDGKTAAVATVEASAVAPVTSREITRSRELKPAS